MNRLSIADTLANPECLAALLRIEVNEPTVGMIFGVDTLAKDNKIRIPYSQNSAIMR
ncbi:MAG: hypothetical protein QGI92_04640 [Dehalococcoidales bacterium]|nr:hypothetical protein [Dehalococcoidales bacterium]MDP7676251.1 hypothetical protein [Dehalococcoidales bacterium]